MNIEGKERELILGYIFERKVNCKQGIFVIKNRIEARQEAIIEYENMTRKEKLKLYAMLMNDKIRKCLCNELENRSLFMNFVNGTPQKRKMRIESFVFYKVRNMSRKEKKEYYKELGYRFFDE